MSTTSVNPVADELHERYPLLWGKALQYDFAERLGGCTDPLLPEINAAMHELWMARSNLTPDQPTIVPLYDADLNPINR